MNKVMTKPGFGLRVHRARTALRKLGQDCLASIYTRGFDNCFEMGDGTAVVVALMGHALNGDRLLEQGIRNTGSWPQWHEVYMNQRAQEDES